jgi:hypothetical protein
MVVNHNSLTAIEDNSPVLDPRRTMVPNDPCWCLSGKKWKKCHKLREYEKEITWNEFKARADVALKEEVCLHPAAPVGCAAKIIRAHTVQRGGGLKYIADGNYVLSAKDEILRLSEHEGELVRVAEGKAPFNPLRVNIKKASTFYGFCANHDGPLFAPVEMASWSPTKNNSFLLSFRAMAYEAYFAIAATTRNEVARQTWDRGLAFEQQGPIQQRLFDRKFGLEMRVRDSKAWKSGYDHAYNTADYSTYRFALLNFQPTLPIVVCGAFHVDFDFQGKQLQKLGLQCSDYEHLTLNITATQDRCIVVFGWIGSDQGPPAQFVRSFLELPDSRKSHLLIQLAFEYLENTYINPLWWDQLSMQQKRSIQDRIFHFTAAHPGRKQNALVDDGACWFDSKVTASTGLIL